MPVSALSERAGRKEGHMDDFKENVIEFLYNQKTATVTFTQGRYISRIKKLAESHPNDCQITAENKDGSIVAHIPTSWVRINPPRSLTDEQREELAKRGAAALNALRITNVVDE